MLIKYILLYSFDGRFGCRRNYLRWVPCNRGNNLGLYSKHVVNLLLHLSLNSISSMLNTLTLSTFASRQNCLCINILNLVIKLL